MSLRFSAFGDQSYLSPFRCTLSVLGSPLNDTTGHSSDRLGVSGAEDIAPELRDRLSRLDMGEPPLNNGTEDDWSADGSASTLHAPTVKQSPLSIAQPNGPSGRGIWMDRSTSETVHSLYTRLGYLLRETVELHARLGALLPHTTPSTSFE
ncbi:unnamed protein product [Dicrocoelium dendriticum]|nr:unnamed protein product [Dicrocoelium dendriticum]